MWICPFRTRSVLPLELCCCLTQWPTFRQQSPEKPFACLSVPLLGSSASLGSSSSRMEPFSRSAASMAGLVLFHPPLQLRGGMTTLGNNAAIVGGKQGHLFKAGYGWLVLFQYCVKCKRQDRWRSVYVHNQTLQLIVLHGRRGDGVCTGCSCAQKHQCRS